MPRRYVRKVVCRLKTKRLCYLMHESLRNRSFAGSSDAPFIAPNQYMQTNGHGPTALHHGFNQIPHSANDLVGRAALWHDVHTRQPDSASQFANLQKLLWLLDYKLENCFSAGLQQGEV